MGALESSKAHSLAKNEGAKKGNKTYMKKKDLDWEKGPNLKSNEDTSNSKGRKEKGK